MQTKRYKVVFDGRIVEGYEIDTVKENLVSLLKIDEQKAERLFDSKPTVIKRNVDYRTAMKYKKACEKVGAMCKISKTEPFETNEVSQPGESNIMTCPNCGHQRTDSLSECMKCGIIFSKVVKGDVNKASLRAHYQQLSDEDIKRLANSEAKALTPDEWNILKEEIERRGFSEELNALLDSQTGGVSDVPDEQIKRPKRKYFGTTIRWFLLASVGTIPLFVMGSYLPEGLWRLIAGTVFWPTNLALFLMSPPSIGVGPEAYGHQLAFLGFFLLVGIPLNGIGWGFIGFVQLVVRDVLSDGFRPHWKKLMTIAILLSLTLGAVAFRPRPLPPIREAISASHNIRAFFSDYFANPEAVLPQEINSWSEFVNFLDSFGYSGFSERAEDHRLQFISYKSFERPGDDSGVSIGFVLYFSIDKPKGIEEKFIEITSLNLQRLTQQEYSTIRQIRDALMRYAEMSEDRGFPREINTWEELVSICDSNGANLSQSTDTEEIRFLSYKYRSNPGYGYYVLRLETSLSHGRTEEREVVPW
jgi:hypothetical protein